MKFATLYEKPPKRISVVRGEVSQTFKQLPDLIVCGLKFGPACQKAAHKKEKRECAIEQPKLDNARRTEMNLFHRSG